MLTKIKTSKNILIVGIILIIIGIAISVVPFIMSFHKELEEDKLIDEYLEMSIPIETEKINQIETKEESNTNTQINYLMVLEVPKIGLKKGIYNINSKYNSVNYGIQIMKESEMPNIDKSNLALASHRGTSSISYFNKLEYLNNGDIVIIYYQGYKYIYEISNIYEEEKDGSIKIIKDNSKTTISLITCKRNSKDKQLVFIGNMIGVEEIE